MLLPAGLGAGRKVSFTGLDNVSGLGRHEGSVGVGGEGGGDGGDGHMVSKEGVEIGSGGVTGDQVHRDLGLTLLAAVHHSGSRVDVGGANEGVVAMGGLSGVVVGGGSSNIGVEGGNSTVGVGDQVGGGGGGVVGVVGGDGTIGVVHQLGRGTSNKERATIYERFE